MRSENPKVLPCLRVFCFVKKSVSKFWTPVRKRNGAEGSSAERQVPASKAGRGWRLRFCRAETKFSFRKL